MEVASGTVLGPMTLVTGSPKPVRSTGSAICTSGMTPSFTATGDRTHRSRGWVVVKLPRTYLAGRPVLDSPPDQPCPARSGRRHPALRNRMILKAPFQPPADFLRAFGYRGGRRF